jgi:uncharacterized membrane protein YkoI
VAKRSYGTGRLYVVVDAGGRASWYGSWRVGGARVNRKLGVKRTVVVTVAAIGAAAVSGSAGRRRRHLDDRDSCGVKQHDHNPAKHDPSRGGHTVNGKTETLLTRDTAAKVKAGALAKVPGTVARVETKVDSGAPYEPHIEKSYGTEVEVQIHSDYRVAAVNAMGGHPQHRDADDARAGAWPAPASSG